LTYETGTGQPVSYSWAIQQCLGWVKDSFCDTVCGNDAYTAPTAQAPDPGPSYTRMFSNRFRYDAAPDINLGQTPSAHTYYPILRVPLYGHNSNNDAQAVAAMFAGCKAVKSWLDGHCDVLKSQANGCGADWGAITTQINYQIRRACIQCNGVRMYNYSITA